MRAFALHRISRDAAAVARDAAPDVDVQALCAAALTNSAPAIGVTDYRSTPMTSCSADGGVGSPFTLDARYTYASGTLTFYNFASKEIFEFTKH